jgi:hypothetical protein
VAVHWYLRYGLFYRDVDELPPERDVEVDHVTVYRWVQRFTPLFADAARFTQHAPGQRRFVDETYVKVNGVWRVRVSGGRPARAGHRHPGVEAPGRGSGPPVVTANDHVEGDAD